MLTPEHVVAEARTWLGDDWGQDRGEGNEKTQGAFACNAHKTA